MNHHNSGLAHGTSGSPQATLENEEARVQAVVNAAKKIYPGGRTYKEYEALARDPSHGNHVTEQAQKEREIGLDLERQGFLHKIFRDPESNGGAEFIDSETHIKWDIKSFISYPNGHVKSRKGAFSVQNALKKIYAELDKGHHVILDTRKLVQEHRQELYNAIDREKISAKILWYPPLESSRSGAQSKQGESR